MTVTVSFVCRRPFVFGTIFRRDPDRRWRSGRLSKGSVAGDYQLWQSSARATHRRRLNLRIRHQERSAGRSLSLPFRFDNLPPHGRRRWIARERKKVCPRRRHRRSPVVHRLNRRPSSSVTLPLRHLLSLLHCHRSPVVAPSSRLYFRVVRRALSAIGSPLSESQLRRAAPSFFDGASHSKKQQSTSGANTKAGPIAELPFIFFVFQVSSLFILSIKNN